RVGGGDPDSDGVDVHVQEPADRQRLLRRAGGGQGRQPLAGADARRAIASFGVRRWNRRFESGNCVAALRKQPCGTSGRTTRPCSSSTASPNASATATTACASSP